MASIRFAGPGLRVVAFSESMLLRVTGMRLFDGVAAHLGSHAIFVGGILNKTSS